MVCDVGDKRVPGGRCAAVARASTLDGVSMAREPFR